MVITLDGITGSGELYLNIMKIICGPREKDWWRGLWDLMCHRCPYNWQLDYDHFTLVDIIYRGIEVPQNLDFMFIRGDVIDVLGEYHNPGKCMIDTIVCADGIEHLSKENGKRLILEMEEHATKQIIFTPLGELSVTNDDHPDAHKSGWKPEDFPGWTSIVIPNFHPQLNFGAFFAFNCSDQEKQRIYNEIKSKYVESRID